MLVAVRFTLEASEDVAERRSSFQLKRWEAYARLHKKVYLMMTIFCLWILRVRRRLFLSHTHTYFR